MTKPMVALPLRLLSLPCKSQKTQITDIIGKDIRYHVRAKITQITDIIGKDIPNEVGPTHQWF
jgi:hypothetical protein